jgi:uncharacterized protein YbjQ (UPF0145 family)
MTMRPTPALSDLSVTEFLALSRMGFLPHGLVIGSCVFEADTTPTGQGLFASLLAPVSAAYIKTGEVVALSQAVRSARAFAIYRMREQAAKLHAEGVVGVRLSLEHHVWKGGHQVVKFIAMGTGVGFDHDNCPVEFRGSPSLRLANGTPFASDLSGQDFVALMRAGYRPITVASGSCVYRLNPNEASQYQGQNAEIAAYTRAFFDARELAMERLQQDVFAEWPPGHPDAPTGIVGMTVTEEAHRQAINQRQRQAQWNGPMVPVVEFTAVGTAVAPLHPSDPRRAKAPPKPTVVVPLDR